MTAGALQRVILRGRTQRAESAEHCDVCSLRLIGDHRHLLDTEQAQVMCACQACSLLFVQGAASRGHYRLIPQRRRRLDAVSTKRLGVPVGLAYFVPRNDGSVIAHYPSPLGSTEWEIDPSAWQEVVTSCPALAGLATDVEALLVNTSRGRQQYWIVPIDDCFRLIAIVRREWQGLSGGGRVWPEIDAFFEQLPERQRRTNGPDTHR